MGINVNKIMAKKVYKPVQEKMQALSMQLYSNLVYNTPVDTGHARANWTVSVDNAYQGVKDTTTVDYALTASTIKSFDIMKNHAIVIGNNTPYIVKLNSGHSKQADPNFVERSMAVSIAEVL